MKLKKYSEYPPDIRRIGIIWDIIRCLFVIIPVIAIVSNILSFHGLEYIAETITSIYLILLSVSVIILSVSLTIGAFRQKRIAAGIFLAFMSLTIPTVILLAVTEKGRALVLYILEGY